MTLSQHHTIEDDACCGMGCHGDNNDLFHTCCWQLELALSQLCPGMTNGSDCGVSPPANFRSVLYSQNNGFSHSA